MGWTTPTDRTTGYVVTATDWNVVEDNLTFLYGDLAWTNVTVFTNSWAAGGAGNLPRFIKTGNTVFMQGLITGGTLALAAFTLPAGYRPSQTQRFAVEANNAFGYLSVSTAGVVILQVGSTTNASIDCSFSVI